MTCVPVVARSPNIAPAHRAPLAPTPPGSSPPPPPPLPAAQLLDAGLRRLVGRALRVRVRTFRDYAQGDLFLGRSYDINSDDAPRVEVDRLENVEFDSQDRVIITGRAKVRASSESQQVANGFKVRRGPRSEKRWGQRAPH